MYELTGTCFIDAIRYGVMLHQSGQATPDDRVTVVHGIVNAGGGDFVHAWAEHNGRAWQGAYKNREPVYIAAPADHFRSVLKVRDSLAYTLDEALALADQTKHCGPWDDDLMAAAEKCGTPRSVSGINRLKLTHIIPLDVQHGITDFRKQLLPDRPTAG